jgi:hypothetical protein
MLRNGVVMPVQLQLTWHVGARTYERSQPLYIFSRDPFAIRQTFLENARIQLFDLDGNTAELLEKHEIPHSRLLDLAAIDLVTEGIVLVGEGVSLREQRKLPATLIRAAQRGVPVLCLAPVDGDFPLEIAQDGRSVRPSRFTLERGAVVRRYDERFDQLATDCHLSLETRRNEVVIAAADGQADWSWLEMSFPTEKPGKPNGSVIVCGFGIVSQWEASPVPRYLFVRLLEELTAESALEKEDAYTQR